MIMVSLLLPQVAQVSGFFSTLGQHIFIFTRGATGIKPRTSQSYYNWNTHFFKLMGDTHKLENICPNYVTYKKSENAMSEL